MPQNLFEATLRLDVRQLSHRFSDADNIVLNNINLQVKQGNIHYLLGPSGCGKTTLLRLIVGLESLQQGALYIAGQDSGHLPPEKRRIGLVFQDHALFPNMTTRQNIAFGLRSRGRMWQSWDKKTRMNIDAMIMRFGLDAVADHYPHQLSGGQQQRVGIARALIARPALLLLDEPFSSLDTRTKDKTRDDILHLLHATSTSALIVSHDPEDALHMADHMTILTPDGQVAQSGSPAEIYFHPNSPYVASFMTEINTIPGMLHAQGVQTQFGFLPLKKKQSLLLENTPVQKGMVVVRPEGIKLLPATHATELTPASAQVMAARVLGNASQIHLRTITPDGAELHIHVRENGVYIPKVGSLHGLVIDANMAYVFTDNAI